MFLFRGAIRYFDAMMPIVRFAAALLILAGTTVSHAQPQTDSRIVAGVTVDYSDYAGLALAAPVVGDAVIRSANRVNAADAVGLPTGYARFYVTGDIVALIRGPAGLPVRTAWLADVALDARGKTTAPKKRTRVLIFARTLPAHPVMVQLISRDAQRAWSAEADRFTRAVLTEALASDAPPVVTGVGSAFFVPGALPGEGETQIFLQTNDGRPVSLSVIRTADGQRSWSVALSEVTAAAAPPPARDTLLWYRLACALPSELPAASAVDDVPANAAAAQDDYRFVIGSLGNCAYPARR